MCESAERQMPVDRLVLSVVMPAYQCADTIGESIKSVLAQAVPLELIIVDDCSPTPVAEALAAFAQDPRVRVYRNESNLGVANTRNRGIALAAGDYIAFLDADDIWAPDKIVRQLALLEKTGGAFCATARELMTPAGDLTGRVIPVPEIITYSELLKHNCINCSSVVMKAEIAREFPMHHAQYHEDYIMWLEILKKYGTACAVNEPLLKYRLTNTGKSGSKLHSAKMTFGVYRSVGFGRCQSALLWTRYAFNGVKKYARSYLGG